MKFWLATLAGVAVTRSPRTTLIIHIGRLPDMPPAESEPTLREEGRRFSRRRRKPLLATFSKMPVVGPRRQHASRRWSRLCASLPPITEILYHFDASRLKTLGLASWCSRAAVQDASQARHYWSASQLTYSAHAAPGIRYAAPLGKYDIFTRLGYISSL